MKKGNRQYGFYRGPVSPKIFLGRFIMAQFGLLTRYPFSCKIN